MFSCHSMHFIFRSDPKNANVLLSSIRTPTINWTGRWLIYSSLSLSTCMPLPTYFIEFHILVFQVGVPGHLVLTVLCTFDNCIDSRRGCRTHFYMLERTATIHLILLISQKIGGSPPPLLSCNGLLSLNFHCNSNINDASNDCRLEQVQIQSIYCFISFQ
jgi:hypothetical protein